MPNSIHVQLADAIVSELNSGSRSWTGQFTSVRKWRPKWSATQLASLQVAVVPLTIETERIARGASKMRYSFVVGIDFQKLLNPASATYDADLDTLDKLAQDVADFYQDGHEIVSGYPVLIAERDDVYNFPLLWGESEWETFLAVGMQGFR